eukprot:COSAG01_NODE_161_length_23642_cov_713.337000_2_plen_429_part_00
MFWPFFSRVLEQIHGLGAEPEEKEAAANSPVSPSADEADHSSKWTLDDALLFEDIGVEPLPLCLSVSRNIEGFTMIATMDQQERISLEDCLTDAFDSLIEMPEWSGRYVSLTPGHPNEISNTEYKQFIAEGLMPPPTTSIPAQVMCGMDDDWPYGRGAYISADEQTTISVGFEDHLIISALDSAATEVEVILDRLRVSLALLSKAPSVNFMRDDNRCGYITSSPARAGTGMDATAQLKLLGLTMDGTANRVREIIASNGLPLVVKKRVSKSHMLGNVGAGMAQGLKALSAEVGSDGVVELAVTRTFGVSEAWIAKALYDGVGRIQTAEAGVQGFGTSHGRVCLWLTQWTRKLQRQAREAKGIAEENARRMADIAERAAQMAEAAADYSKQMAEKVGSSLSMAYRINHRVQSTNMIRWRGAGHGRSEKC